MEEFKCRVQRSIHNTTQHEGSINEVYIFIQNQTKYLKQREKALGYNTHHNIIKHIA